MTDDSGKRAPGDGPSRRDFSHVYRTPIRTSTAAMVVAFVGLLILYGYTSDHYAALDAQNEQRPAPTAPRFTPTHTTPPTTSTSVSHSSQTSAPSASSTSDSTPSSSQSQVPSMQLPLPTEWLPQAPKSEVPTPGNQAPPSQ